MVIGLVSRHGVVLLKLTVLGESQASTLLRRLSAVAEGLDLGR